MARYVKRGKTWQYEISYKDENGKFKKLRKSGFAKKSDAKIAATEIETKLAKGLKVTNNDILLSDHFEQWMELYKKPFVTGTTYRKYRNTLRNIKVYFKNDTIKSLTRTTYQKRLNVFSETHADASVERFNIHIKASLENLVDDGVIPYNFTKKAIVKGQVPSVPEEEKYLNYDDFERLMRLAAQNLDPHFASRFLIVVGGSTGMRFGELLGLTWDNVDLDNGVIHVVRAWDYIDKKDFCPVKNEQSVRDVPIDDATLKIMKDFKTQQTELFQRLKIKNPKNFVFYNCTHGLISHRAALNKLKELQRQLNIKPMIKIHGLRHTHASVMIYKGTDVLAVSKHLGHKSLNVTTSTYSHAIKELKEREDEKIKLIMEDIFKK